MIQKTNYEKEKEINLGKKSYRIRKQQDKEAEVDIKRYIDYHRNQRTVEDIDDKGKIQE